MTIVLELLSKLIEHLPAAKMKVIPQYEEWLSWCAVRKEKFHAVIMAVVNE